MLRLWQLIKNTTTEGPYDPPFDFALPDYTSLGRALLKMVHSFPDDDGGAPAELEPPVDIAWEPIPLPELRAFCLFDALRYR